MRTNPFFRLMAGTSQGIYTPDCDRTSGRVVLSVFTALWAKVLQVGFPGRVETPSLSPGVPLWCVEGHRSRGHVQDGGHLLHRMAFSDQLKNLQLPARELGIGFAALQVCTNEPTKHLGEQRYV
jgi:hypothetical protein